MVRRRISRAAYISGSKDLGTARELSFGISIPRISFAPDCPVITYHPIPDVFSLEVVHGTVETWPDRDEIAKVLKPMIRERLPDPMGGLTEGDDE